MSFPFDKPYVLVVGTIEIRKNHALALAAWRALLLRHSADRVPLLVFAGSWGWHVDKLRGEIEASNRLDGHLHIVEHPSDTALAQLYRGARLTLFPSLYEGWGLPVAESLAHGKVCVASDSSSIPEVSRGLSVLFRSGDLDDLLAVLEPLLLSDKPLRRLEARIAAEFVPVPWSTTYSDAVAALGDMAAPGARWWFDVGTLLHFKRSGRTLTGIPRMMDEVLRAADGTLRMVAHDPATHALQEIDCLDMPAPQAPPRTAARGPISRAVRHAVRLAGRLRPGLPRVPAPPRGLSHPFAAGDVYMNLGPWWEATEVFEGLRGSGVAIGVALCDMIPERFPEWFEPHLSHLFRERLPLMTSAADAVLCISDATAADLRDYIHRAGVAEPRVARMRLGDYFKA